MCPKTGQKVAFFPILEELPVSNLFLTTIMGLNVAPWGRNLARRPKSKFQDPNFNAYDYEFFHLEPYQSEYDDLPMNCLASKLIWNTQLFFLCLSISRLSCKGSYHKFGLRLMQPIYLIASLPHQTTQSSCKNITFDHCQTLCCLFQL